MTDFTPIDITGIKPVERIDVPGDPGLEWIPIDQLVVDHRYQRTISGAGRRVIRKVASEFDWSKFQPILVAPIGSDRYAVVDGQHRAHAAKLRGLETIPAFVVEMDTTTQALGFAAVNRDHIRLHALNIYRAELAAGSEWAIECDAAVRAARCQLATSNFSAAAKRPGQIFAIGLIRKMVSNGEGEAVTAGLLAIRNSMAGAEVTQYAGPILTVWLQAIAKNQRFLRLPLASIFDELDIWTMLDDAKLRARQQGGAARPLVIDAIAHRLREEMA